MKMIGKGGIWAALVIIGLGLMLGQRSIERFPHHNHTWAQSDWYAIALGFTNNGYDLLHPETMIYNKQFPDKWEKASTNTVTAADFPIHGYIVALLMGLFDDTSAQVYRIWTLICSLLGMWFLYLLGRRVTGSGLKAVAIVAFAMMSPLYALYFTGCLPSVPSLALTMAGLWAYVKYWQEGRRMLWNLAITLLTLGAMTRTSQAIVPVAVCGYEMLRVIRRETTLPNKLPAVLLSGAAIGGYLLWNAHLRAEYGSLFLPHLMPLQGWGDLTSIWKNYHYVYFSLPQLILMGALVAGACAALMANRRSTKSNDGRQLPLWLLLAIWLFGEGLFFIAMGGQFPMHEYYFLDSFYLPVVFGVMLTVKHIPLPRKTGWRIATLAALLAAAWPIYRAADNTLEERTKGYDLAYLCYLNYLGSDQWLDEIGISRDARILSVASYPQNLPFILMGRKGYTAQWISDDFDMTSMLTSALTFPFDYVVTEEWYLRNRFDQYRVVYERLIPVAKHGSLWLCTAADTVVNSSPEDFFTQ